MGLNLYGRTLNDNAPKRRGGLDEVPISAEDWRHPPVIAAEAGVRWYCISTVPQGEYRCSDALSDAGVASYVPTETMWTRRRKGRDMLKVQTQAPLWRGYSFVRIASDRDWAPVYARDAFGRSRIGALGVIGAHGAPMAIYAGKLAALANEERAGWFDDSRRAALIAGRDAKPEPIILAGEVVKIVDGPFAGLEGIAENDNDRHAARISIEMFGKATIATIGLEALENITRPQLAGVALRRA